MVGTSPCIWRPESFSSHMIRSTCPLIHVVVYTFEWDKVRFQVIENPRLVTLETPTVHPSSPKHLRQKYYELSVTFYTFHDVDVYVPVCIHTNTQLRLYVCEWTCTPYPSLPQGSYLFKGWSLSYWPVHADDVENRDGGVPGVTRSSIRTVGSGV